MAETYKGLTIRIGGDATNLQKALRSTESAITRTQTQLRKMSQALRMDPGSTSAINKQLDLMGNSAVETQKKVLQLQRAIERAGGEKIELFGGKETTKTVSQLAEETSDVSRRAAEAADNYSVLNGQIEGLYASINKAARASENFGKKYDIRNYRDDLESQFAKMGDLGIDDVINDLRKLRPAWEDAFNENEIAKAIEKLRDTDSELIKTQASAKKAAETFAEMSLSAQRMSISPDIDKELSGIRRSSEVLSDSLDRAQRALKLDPSNANAAVMAMQRLDDAANLAEQEITLLQKKISALNANGANLTARGMNNISDEARKAAEAYTEATRNLTEMRAEITRCEDGMRKLELAGKTNGDEYTDLENSVREARVEVERLEQAQAEAFNNAKRYDLASQYEDAKLRVTELTSQVNSYRKAQSEITAPKSFLSSTTMMDLGMTLSTSVTPAIIGMGYAAIQSAQDIDSAYRDMRKTVNGSEDDFEALRQAAIDFSTTHVTSADQILSIQAIGGELGVAVEDLETFAQTVSNLEIATDLDADEAATSLGQLSNIMNDLSGEKMPAFSDALVRLGNNGASTESQIVDIAARIGSMSSIIGMSTPEVLAWASTIASTGQGAEAAGTAIANTMSDIEQAVAGGGDALEAFAQVSQMGAEDFARAWESDPSSAMKAFIEGLNKIEADGGSATGTLSALGITAARQVQAIEGLMQTVGMLDDNLQMSENAWNGVSDQWGEAGDAANEAAKKAEGFSGSVQRLMNMAQVLGAEMGESLAPVIDFIADALGGLTQVFSSAPDSVKLFTSAILGLVAAAGPALMWIRAIGDTVKDIKSWSAAGKGVADVASSMDDLLDATTGTVKSTGLLTGGFTGLGIAIAGVGITALISKMIEVQTDIDNTKKATDEFTESINSMTSQLVSGRREIGDFGEEADGVFDEFTIDAKTIYQANLELAEGIRETSDAASAQITQLGQAQSVIDEYANKTGLTSEQQGKLRAAIDLVNQLCGTQYEVVDAANGKIADERQQILDTVDAINEYIAAKQNQIRLDALNASYADATETYAENIANATKAQKEYNSAIDDYEKKWGDIDSFDAATASLDQKHDFGIVDDARSSFEDMSDAARESGEVVNSLAGDIGLAGRVAEGSADDIEKFVSTSTELAGGLGASGKSLSEMSDALHRTGVSIEDLNSLSEDELAELGANFNGTVDSIVDYLDETGKTVPAQGLGIVLGFSDGIQQGTADAVNAAMNVADITVDQFRGYTEQYQLTGEEQIAAFANALANGDTYTSAAIAAYGGTEGIASMLGEYGIKGSESVQAFIDAINAGDTFNAALQKARDVASGITSGKPEVDTASQSVADSASGNLTDTGDLATAWYNAVASIAGAIWQAGQSAISTAWGIANSIWSAVTSAGRAASSLASASGSGGGFSGGGGGGVGGGGGGIFRSAPAHVSAQAYTATQSQTAASLAKASSASARVLTDNQIQAQASTAAARASALAFRVTANSTASGVRSINKSLTRNPPYPGSGVRASDEARTVNVTIDGIGTTARVQSIALNLLDELERVGAI